MTEKSQARSPSAEQPDTFFDILAILCYGIHCLPNARQENVYRIFSASYEGYNKSVREKFLFLAGNGQSVAYYYSLTDGQATQLLAALRSAESDAEWAMLLAAVEAIDSLLELRANLERFLLDKPCPAIPLNPEDQPHASSDYRRFDILNPATRDYGLLLPREPCRWQRQSERTMDSVSFRPLSAMKNYIWVRPDFDYQIINLHSKFDLLPDQRLKIVASPLCSQAPFLLHCHPENCSFEIEYTDDGTSKINARFEKAIHISVEEQANIAVFPEMMASPSSIRHCAKYVRTHWKQDMPNLILLPTCEYLGKQGWINELTALDADGGCIFTYHKQHPFRFEKKLEKKTPDAVTNDGQSPGIERSDRELERPKVFDEPIHADRMIYLLHIPGVGRIGFLICSDVFREGYLDALLQELKVTLLLHIVYSPGADLLERTLAAAKRNLCDVIVCNTCAAWDDATIASEKRPPVKMPNNPLINKYYPYGHKYSSPQPSLNTCARQECPGCVFVVEAANTYGGRQVPVIKRYQ